MPLEITPVTGGWLTANVVFKPYVDYPEDFLYSAMGVLRAQMFMNDTPLRWSLWRQACRTKNHMLNALVFCSECRQIRHISMRILFSTSPRMKKLSLTCAEVGMICGQPSTNIIDELDLNTSKTTT